MLFVDRDTELAALQREYERAGSSLVILYGRRRVGKTTLISRFIRDKHALFFLASEESEAQNRRAFRERAAEFLDDDLLREADVPNWDVIFRAFFRGHTEEKPVIVIDEFQYIGRSNPAFPSVFQRIWDEILQEQSVMVILCGSLISMMTSQTLSYSSPLYGRRTAQICLKQIPFRYYSAFFPELGRRELIERYAVTGGVPKYIESFTGEADLYEAIDHCILNRSGYLYDEPYFLLQQEVSEVGSYFSVLRAIAAGNHKLSAIAASLEVKSTDLTRYLKTLIDLDILEREVPVTEPAPEKSKRGLYRIRDNYLRFWFAYIYPARSLLENGNGALVLDRIRNSLIPGHTAFVYEDVCRAYMWELNAAGCWPFLFSAVGRWWDSQEEIDIAAIDPEGKNLILGECKFWNHPVGSAVLHRLEGKAVRVDWQRAARREWYVLFSASGFTEELQQAASIRDDLLLIEY